MYFQRQKKKHWGARRPERQNFLWHWVTAKLASLSLLLSEPEPLIGRSQTNSAITI